MELLEFMIGILWLAILRRDRKGRMDGFQSQIRNYQLQMPAAGAVILRDNSPR
jgi:hypothetical protein